MELRFYIDSESDAPHIYKHDVRESRLRKSWLTQGKISRGETVLGLR